VLTTDQKVWSSSPYGCATDNERLIVKISWRREFLVCHLLATVEAKGEEGMFFDVTKSFAAEQRPSFS
jgi:hypothetical protein